jgi:hypothetical protein
VLGPTSIAALAISTKVGHAVTRFAHLAAPVVAGRAQVEAQLEAIREQLCERAAAGRDVARLEEVLGYACARTEEWSA